MARSSTRKRKIEEVMKFEDVQNPIANASVHGAMVSLSKVKKGRSAVYFDGAVSDGFTRLRLVGFRPEQRQQLLAFYEERKAVNLYDCEVKRSRQGPSMEVMLKSCTTIVKSGCSIDVGELCGGESITESELSKMESGFFLNDQVTVRCKVIAKRDVVSVRNGKRKRDFFIADKSGVFKVILWEEHMDDMEERKSYLLKNFILKEYMSERYLALGSAGEVEEVADIGKINAKLSSNVLKKEELEKWKNVLVIAVPLFDVYKGCLVCNARVEPSTPPFGRCSKCAVQQRMDICQAQTTAKVMIMGQSKMVTVSLYGKMVHQFANVSDDTEVSQEALLAAPAVKEVVFDKNKVVISISR